jgi:hypothetical protein
MSSLQGSNPTEGGRPTQTRTPSGHWEVGHQKKAGAAFWPRLTGGTELERGPQSEPMDGSVTREMEADNQSQHYPLG